MPFKPIATPEDYPERTTPRRPWDEWGPQQQAENMRKCLGEDLWEWLEGETSVPNNDVSRRSKVYR